MAAGITASKLLNPRNPALQSLILGRLLHPAAASPTLLGAQPLDIFHREKVSTADSDSPAHYLPYSSLHAPHLPLDQRRRFDFSAIEIEAARTYVPMEGDVHHDFDGDDDDDDDDEEEDEDDVDIQDYSGSDFDDEEDDERL